MTAEQVTDKLVEIAKTGVQGMSDRICTLERENERLLQWVHDLQSGMYINCVYCGHRYGPNDEVPATMADVLKEHIEVCPEHPMSRLKQRWEEAIRRARYVYEGEHTPNEVIDYLLAEVAAIEIEKADR